MEPKSNPGQHDSPQPFPRDIHCDAPPLFMTIELNTFTTFKEASQLLMSLVDFLSEGNNLDFNATDRACALLEYIDGQFSSDKSIFKLVQRPNDSCSEQITQYALSSSLTLVFTDCIHHLELQRQTRQLILNILRGISAWQKDNRSVQKRGHQILTKLREEGISDEIELRFRCRDYYLREDFGLVEVLPGETFLNYKQRVIDILRTQSHCRRMWRHFNDTPIPSVFKHSISKQTTPVKTDGDNLSSSKGVASHIDLLHVRDYSRNFPFNPLRLFHLLPKPDEPPLSEFRNGPIVTNPPLPLQRGFGDPMELFCPTHTLKLDAQSFSTFTSSFYPPLPCLRNPFTPLEGSDLYDTIHPKDGLKYVQPIGHPSFPFYSPFATHSALPVPYSSSLTPLTNDTPGNHCLVTHAQETLPEFEKRIMGSVESCDNLSPNHLCSKLLSQHPKDSYPLLLFLVPAQLHLYPVHTQVTSADEIVLNGMVQQDPTFSLPRSQTVDGAELFNSVAGVLTQGRRIVSQSVFSATEDWHYVLDKLNSIIRPTIEKVQLDWDRPNDPHRPIVTLDRMNGSGVDVRAFVTGHTFGELALLKRRPTIADLLIRSSSQMVNHIRIHPEVEALTLNADIRGQLILRLPPPRDQKLKYLQLLRIAAHLNHVAPESEQKNARLTAASLLPQFSSHFDIPLHSQNKPRFADFIERFIDFIIRVLLVEVKTFAELANAGKTNEISLQLSKASQSVNEPTLLTIAPKKGAITDFLGLTIINPPKSTERHLYLILPSDMSERERKENGGYDVWQDAGKLVRRAGCDARLHVEHQRICGARVERREIGENGHCVCSVCRRGNPANDGDEKNNDDA
ncbi:hypothetical protein BLNAU_1051 [Blattamonas nauphoetae]|uniref:Cyclic nucleotide-binding domain-containing protein n=1 Tax=Blattamonas nauphoetae TaxID=2049346 RepID=A0ABQ9YJN2_9EUKA|nr:hypothetical protein BLNAU_1051 [Blattamonas nauphoetae]